MDEIQRIRAAMESGNPVVPEPLQQLIKAQAAVLGEDGDAIIQDIQEEAEKARKLLTDIFKLIESCRMDLGKRAALQELSNEMIRAKEPERLVQVEAIREQVTRYNRARASGDNGALKEAGLMLKQLVGKYMSDVGKDEEDRLAPDTAQMWKDQVYEILRGAPHFPDGSTEGDSAPTASSASAALAALEPPDGLAPLRLAIRLATRTMEAVAREIQDPDETTLRGFGRHLGNLKKEIMAVHVTGADGKRHRQGDSGRTCVFKDVMGCTAMHPPWLCKVFGKLPAGERERLTKDNRLCPFCLLHDKDKPCGAKQKPVACTASGCKGKHIQKLHDFLKDVFREESQVHMVHGDDGWEESEEAWELGEEEMMIVGTV